MSKNVINIWNPKFMIMANAQQYFLGSYVNWRGMVLFLNKSYIISQFPGRFVSKTSQNILLESNGWNYKQLNNHWKVVLETL